MEGLILLVIVAGLALVAGSFISFVNLSSISKLRAEVDRLNRIAQHQRQQIAKLFDALELNSGKSSSPQDAQTSETTLQNKSSTSDVNIDVGKGVPEETPTNISEQPRSAKSKTPEATQVPKAAKTPAKPKKSFDIEKFMMGNGLLWLGGIVLAFGGVFLAKYSIEAGLFPPELRIILGAAFGVALVAGAEYLYQHPKRFQITTPLISASLASGGIITCFAMAYVAFDFYAFLSPLFAFVVLAIIAIAGTALSLRYGPILALIGVVGAYAVPALVSTGSNNIFALLIYVAFVSGSAVWVHSVVKQGWLWWLTLVGNMAWLFISVALGEPQYVWVIFAFSLVSIYLYVIVPVMGWKVGQTHLQALPVKTLLMPRKEQLGIFLPVIAIALMFIGYTYQHDFVVMLCVASAVLLIMPFRHSAFDTWPYLSLFLVVVMYFVMPSTYDTSDNLFPFTDGYLLVQVCAIAFIAYCMIAIKISPLRPSYLLLLVFAPLSLFGMAYGLSPLAHSTFLYPVWSIELMLIAAVFVILAFRTDALMHKMSFLLLANGALTLTFTMLLSPSVLSFAIVVQVTLMSFLSQKFRLVLPTWIYKIAISAVILRLTLAPWLPEYADETVFTVHWSLLVYPLVIGFLWLANTYQQNTDLKAWCKGAMLHIVALFVTTETSYLLTGSYPDFGSLGFIETVLLSMNWLILSAIYVWRAKLSQHKTNSKSGVSLMPKVYGVYAFLLGFAAAAFHLDMSVINNPFLVYQETGEGLFVNWLFPMWAVPALVLYACIRFALIDSRFTKVVWGVIGIFSAMYINGLIRGAYHPVILFYDNGISQQELYVYSLVWLAISILLIVLGQNRSSSTLNRLGFIVLAIVILKAFLVDMANLDGLYRAVSFIGLGLSLVALGWLFQRLNKNTQISTDKRLASEQ